MSTIKSRSSNILFHNACIAMIWIITIYSSIIQYVFIPIPYGLPVLGVMLLSSYILANSETPFVFSEMITKEVLSMLCFMGYILISGILFAPNINNHISQWVTCLEYIFVQIIIVSIIKRSGTDTFHTMLLVNSVMLSIIFIRNPISYQDTGRFSISEHVNPNGLGLWFVAGIWVTLYRQINKKQSLVFTGILVALLGYCILLTGSRKSLIGAALTIILWLIFCFLPNLKEKSAFNGMISFVVLLFLIIIIAREFLSVYGDTKIASRMGRLFYEASEGKRSNMYQAGYEMLKMNPLFGIGFQGFRYYFGTYSHATLVEIPVSGGVVGSFLYFIAYFISFKKITTIYIFTKGQDAFHIEHKRIKMLIIFWIVMAFYTVCIIHPYEFGSGIYFGLIYGETAYIEKQLRLNKNLSIKKKIGSRYIKI